jgi:hypothetical protein
MIKQSVINSFKRVGIPYEALLNYENKTIARNRFTGEEVETTVLIKYLIDWVYQTNNEYEMLNMGDKPKVNISDFDRIRYFVLDQDQNAYNICLD